MRAQESRVTLSATDQVFTVDTPNAADGYMAQWRLPLPEQSWPAPGEKHVYNLAMELLDGTQLKASERLVIIAQDSGSDPQTQSQSQSRMAVIVNSPGGASQVLLSPFDGSAAAGALSVDTVDYDDVGGVIVSGRLTQDGSVRVYSNDLAIAETGRFEDGSWVVIAGNVIPEGQSRLRIVHRLSDGQGGHGNYTPIFTSNPPRWP